MFREKEKSNDVKMVTHIQIGSSSPVSQKENKSSQVAFTPDFSQVIPQKQRENGQKDAENSQSMKMKTFVSIQV